MIVEEGGLLEDLVERGAVGGWAGGWGLEWRWDGIGGGVGDVDVTNDGLGMCMGMLTEDVSGDGRMCLKMGL